MNKKQKNPLSLTAFGALFGLLIAKFSTSFPDDYGFLAFHVNLESETLSYFATFITTLLICMVLFIVVVKLAKFVFFKIFGSIKNESSSILGSSVEKIGTGKIVLNGVERVSNSLSMEFYVINIAILGKVSLISALV